MKNDFLPCPFCGSTNTSILILDDEFNVRNEEYEKEPYSGLQYAISHPENQNEDCPIANDPDLFIGMYGYDTRKEAMDAWNRPLRSHGKGKTANAKT